jgi:hypothetical protein
MWKRRDGGYFIVAGEMIKMAIDFNEQSDRRGRPSVPGVESTCRPATAASPAGSSAAIAASRSSGPTGVPPPCPAAGRSAANLVRRT